MVTLFRNQHYAVIHHPVFLAEQNPAQGELHQGVGGVVPGMHLLHFWEPGGVCLREHNLAAKGEH